MEAHDLQVDPFADLMAADLTLPPDQAMWLTYNYSSGAVRTGLLTPDALSVVLRDHSFDPNWSSIVALGGGRIAAFNLNTSLLTIGEVDPLGGYADVSNTADAETAHQLRVVNTDTLLFFLPIESGTKGQAVTGRIRADGSYERLREPFQLDFWTHIVPTADGLVLFYNAYTGLAATGRFGTDGSFTDLATFPGFDPWTQILAAADGTLLFYNTTTGAGASGRVEPDGNFVNLFSAFLGPATAFVATRDGRVLVFRSGAPLVARFGGPSGWFSDARFVNGLMPRPELFVR